MATRERMLNSCAGISGGHITPVADPYPTSDSNFDAEDLNLIDLTRDDSGGSRINK